MCPPIPIFSPGSHGLIHSCLGRRVCIYQTKFCASKLSLQHPGLPELYKTAGACSCPAGLLASSLAWFHLSVPQGVYHGRRRHCPLSPIQLRSILCGLWEVQVSTHQVDSSLCAPKQQLSSQHCPVPDTWTRRCHLPPCFRQQVGDLRTRARRKHVGLG